MKYSTFSTVSVLFIFLLIGCNQDNNEQSKHQNDKKKTSTDIKNQPNMEKIAFDPSNTLFKNLDGDFAQEFRANLPNVIRQFPKIKSLQGAVAEYNRNSRRVTIELQTQDFLTIKLVNEVPGFKYSYEFRVNNNPVSQSTFGDWLTTNFSRPSLYGDEAWMEFASCEIIIKIRFARNDNEAFTLGFFRLPNQGIFGLLPQVRIESNGQSIVHDIGDPSLDYVFTLPAPDRVTGVTSPVLAYFNR